MKLRFSTLVVLFFGTIFSVQSIEFLSLKGLVYGCEGTLSGYKQLKFVDENYCYLMDNEDPEIEPLQFVYLTTDDDGVRGAKIDFYVSDPDKAGHMECTITGSLFKPDSLIFTRKDKSKIIFKRK
jgi:hypothetical protein